jgi:transposase
MQIAVIGLDLAKNVFQVHGIDDSGQAAVKRKLRRSEVLPFFAELDAALVGIEACHTAHYWGREIAALGHDVRLMPPQFVKPYIKSQKNDAADAEAIAEAVQRPTMRFVPIKSADQQAVLMLHRTRDLLIRQRSSLISAIRAHFAEFGIVVGQGIRNVERLLALLETAGDQRLPALAAEMLGILAAQLRYVAEQVKEVEVKLLAWHRADETSRRLQSVPGLGPITASAIVATVGDPKQFKSSRQFAAWLGLDHKKSGEHFECACLIGLRPRTSGRTSQKIARRMTGRNSAVSSASPPKPPSKSSRNAPHPTTRSALCFRPCGRLQHIQCTTTFNQAFDASTVPDRSA